MRLIIFLIAIGLSGCALFRDLDKMAETQIKMCNYDGDRIDYNKLVSE